MKQSQQLCAIHKKEVNGMCVESICKYQTRLLCQDCQFTHQKCSKKVPLNTFNTQLQYILNTDVHQGNCSYFLKNSAIQVQIDENVNKLRDKIKGEWLELELKNLQNILLKQSDSDGAQVLLDLRNNFLENEQNQNKNALKKAQRKMSKAELDIAVTLYREKQKFDREGIKNIQTLFIGSSNEFMNSIFSETQKLKDIHYDASKIYCKAEKNAQKMNLEMPLQNIVELLQNKRFQLVQGHNQNSAIVSIIDGQTHLLSGSDDGLIIGWHKPSYTLDFRIKSNDGLNCLGIVKILGQNYLFAGGQGQIQSYSMHTQQKLYALNGHRLQINKMMGYSKNDLISCSKDGTIKIWDISERTMIKSFNNIHEGPVSDFTIIDKELISVGQDGFINFIDLTNQLIKRQLNCNVPIYSIGIIKQNKIVIALGNGFIRILKGNKRQDIQISHQLIWKVLPLNPKMVACLSQDGYLNIVDLKRKKRVFHINFPNDTLWQDIALVDKQLIVPNQGKLEIYSQ